VQGSAFVIKSGQKYPSLKADAGYECSGTDSRAVRGRLGLFAC
jgi:hypothetical protein